MRANESYGLVAGVLLAVCALLLTFYFAPWRSAPQPGALPPELADEPDLYMQGAIITQFQENGAMQYRLAAPEIHHFENEQFSRLRHPKLELRNDPEPPWRVSAVQGEVHGSSEAGGDTLVLLRDSVVVRQQGPGPAYTTIRCAALDVYVERKYAETDGDVMIDTDVGRTTARGLQADFARGSMKLSSATDGTVHTIVHREPSSS